MTGGLIVIGAHPDDEVLIAGGTLAACAQHCIPTAVVSLTRGEQGPIADPTLATRETLAEVRAVELRASCAELDVGFVKCYRRRDGNLRWDEHKSDIVGQLERLLERRRPDAVVTFGEDGLYWHPDHIAAFEFARRAVNRLARAPELYRAVWPQELMVELLAELRRRGLPADLWDMAPEDFGTDDLEGCFALDVRPYVQRKLRALLRHRTQLPDGHALALLDDQLAERFLGIERFAPVAGRSPGWLREALRGV